MAGLEVGLVGLPNSGKSTVFNALTGGGAAVAPHMFSTVETEQRRGRRARPAAGGRSARALGLGQDRRRRRSGWSTSPGSCAARPRRGPGQPVPGQHPDRPTRWSTWCACFRDESVAHPGGQGRPAGRRRDRRARARVRRPGGDRAPARAGRQDGQGRRSRRRRPRSRRWTRSARGSRPGRPARSAGVEMPAAVDLLTAKPTLYVANVDDSGNAEEAAAVEAFAAERGHRVHRRERQDRGRAGASCPTPTRPPSCRTSGSSSLHSTWSPWPPTALLDLIPFFTTGPKETRAWTIRRGQNAQRGRRPHPLRPRPRIHPGRGDRVGPPGRGGLRGRGEAPRLGAGRGPRLRRRRRRHAERAIQRVRRMIAAARRASEGGSDEAGSLCGPCRRRCDLRRRRARGGERL